MGAPLPTGPLDAPRIAMVAGEASGDLLAGLLMNGLKHRWPTLQAHGIGGPKMVQAGFDAWWPSDKLAVRGYVEVLRHYREIVGIRRALRARLLNDRPDIFVGVDAPDFNLALESDMRSHGVKAVHFVCPSIWAWRAERIEAIKASTDHVLCLFPFEPALLAREDIAATYVGHPLADILPLQPDKAAARNQLGLSMDHEVVALLPGSRRSELQYLLPRFLSAAQAMRVQRPALRFVLPAVPALKTEVDRVVQAMGLSEVVRVTAGASHAVLTACDVTLIASGTATLEAALLKRPMVIAYNMHWLSWRIMRRKQLQPWVGLPNILCQEFVVPEYLQDAATPAALAAATLAWLDAPERMAALQTRFADLHNVLRRDTAQLATDAIEKILAR